MKELKFLFYFTVFLQQRQMFSRHYTELLNAISHVCGACFMEMMDFAPCCLINQSCPRKQFACNPIGGHGHISETTSFRFKNFLWHMELKEKKVLPFVGCLQAVLRPSNEHTNYCVCF